MQAATSGSPLWQMVFLSFASVLILFEIVRGWRLGLARQVMRVLAVVTAYGCAIFGGKFMLGMLRPFVKAPDIIISVLAGAILALIVYGAITTIGAILFKRTNQQPAGPVRFLYGICGAVTGIFFGLFTVWLIVIGIRSLGALAQANLQSQAHSKSSPATTTKQVAPQPASPPVVETIAKLKESIELGPVGEIVRQTDVVPNSTYETLGRVGNVFSNPQSAQRFLTYPGAEKLTENPKIIALRDDPEILRMIQNGQFLDLLQDSRIIDAANDPALIRQLKGFDLKRALEYSQQKQ
jgi:hypothetical protein